MKQPDSLKSQSSLSPMKKREGYAFIAFGMILILTSIIVDTSHLVVTSNRLLIFSSELIIQLLSHIGIGFLAIGFITFSIETEHWTHYFETRLSKIVTEK
jgi:hypothetical protein